MAGLLFALGAQPGWAEAMVQRRLPALVHYPWLHARTFSAGPFALALVLHHNVAPPVWQVAGPGPHLVVFGEYLHDEQQSNDEQTIIRELTGHIRRAAWAHIRNRNGLYNLVCWDEELKRLVVANDATGALLLFRTQYEDGWLWCSEPGVLPSAALDVAGLRSLVHIGYQADHRTLHCGVEAMPPAVVEVFTLHQHSITCTIDSALPAPLQHDGSFQHCYQELLRDAVRIRLCTAENVQIPLSGGLDSRLLLGTALEVGHAVVPFTLHGGGQTRDSAVAVRVAQQVGLPCAVVQAEQAIAPHVDLLRYALATTGDWHPTLALPVCGAAQPGASLLLGFLGGTLSGAFVDPGTAERGLAALRANALDPYFGRGHPSARAIAWCQMPAGTVPAPPELLVNLYGRQRRYTSYMVRLAWNFGRPICPFADVRLLRLALAATRHELAGQCTRLELFGRWFPRLAALPSANDGLPFHAPLRRRLRTWARRSGLGRQLRRIAPQAIPQYEYQRFDALARQCAQLIPAPRRASLPMEIAPLALLAVAPVLILESDNTVAALRDLLSALDTV